MSRRRFFDRILMLAVIPAGVALAQAPAPQAQSAQAPPHSP
jgi:hypothetical protein